jgi:hypothetical protein
LYTRGDKVHKLEAGQIYMRKLAIEISVAFQVVNSISNNTNIALDVLELAKWVSSKLFRQS